MHLLPAVDLVDDTWIGVAPRAVADRIHDRSAWPLWWPGLQLRQYQDRGLQGVRWHIVGGSVSALTAGWRRLLPGMRRSLVGSMEIWLEPIRAGVVVHCYARIDPADGAPMASAQADRIRRALAVRSKKIFWEMKDDLEAAR